MTRLENELVVPGALKVGTPIRAIAIKFEWQVLYLKELCASKDIAVETLRKTPTFSETIRQ